MANEVSITIRRSASIAGVSFGSTDAVISVDNPNAFQKLIAAGTDVEVDYPSGALDKLAIAWIEANKACTVNVNDASTGTPDQEITLVANKGLQWDNTQPAAALWLTDAVTKLYVTAAADTILKIAFLSDITPYF